MATDYELKNALPNKSYNDDGTTTDLLGNEVINPVPEYANKPSLPNKWLNPDGSYSTLLELISGAIDTELFVVVDELPATGKSNKIYLLTQPDGTCIEYIYVNDKWDPVGMVQFDLSKYSTTEQMNAAIAAALNSAKAYADTLFADVKPQVFYWGGDTQQTGLDFWNNLLEINKTFDIVVFSHLSAYVDNHIAYIKKGNIHNNGSDARIPFFANQLQKQDTPSYTSGSLSSYYNVTLTKVNNIITRITTNSSGTSAMYLDIGVDYSNPYEPLYPGSPATKKYVDDSITTNITNVLGGSY